MINNRRTFIKRITFSSAALSLFPLITKSNNKFLDKELVFEFVKAGHNDLTKVKTLLRKYPGLLNSAWDWGNGDFETAIGGAGHVGNIDIAEYLISKGARVNLFTLTMLGKTSIVISTLDTFPSLINSKGPHGFSLLHHSTVGGKSKEIYDYLVGKGLQDLKFDMQE